MPTQSSHQTLVRLWELMRLIPRYPRSLTAAELHEALAHGGFATSKRTVERDLVELSRLFMINCQEAQPRGWFWEQRATLEFPSVTLSEALSLRLLEDSLRPIIPGQLLKVLEPRFQLAQRKLEALSEDSAPARWVEKVASVHPALSLLPPDINEQCLAAIQQALLDDLQVHCRYHSSSKGTTQALTLHPLALVQRAQVTYLIATVDGFTDIRRYALHRFTEVAVLESACQRPAGFDLNTWLDEGAMQFGQPRHIELRGWVDSALAARLRETPLAADMQLEAQPGGATLVATVVDSWELKWWLLSQAGSIRIDAPGELRAEIIAHLQQGLALYAPHTKDDRP
ncbi:WYL domain-containing protein [Pseudomonas sp. NPDC007930]|uniref:helix-turn-helix transcriptional regulator n=1 Tax=Pseudomonas sp. NPDC007930 TaxID=3364417 RepID=UPI0036F045C7